MKVAALVPSRDLERSLESGRHFLARHAKVCLRRGYLYKANQHGKENTIVNEFEIVGKINDFEEGQGRAVPRGQERPAPGSGQPVVPMASGGVIKPVYAQQGTYVKYEPKGPDKIPAMLADGEYVLKQDAVSEIGVRNLDILNKALQITGRKGPSRAAEGTVGSAFSDFIRAGTGQFTLTGRLFTAFRRIGKGARERVIANALLNPAR